MTYHLLLFLSIAAPLAPQPITFAGPVFETYSGAGKPASTTKAPPATKGANGKHILRLDVLEAVERLQEQRPKRASDP